MRHYEIVFLVHPDQSDQMQRMLGRYRKLITEADGNIHRFEEWGRRQLAYPIQKLSKAFYVLMNIECEAEVLAKLEESLHFNDAILRWLVIKRKEAVTEESHIMKSRERERTRIKQREQGEEPDANGGAEVSTASTQEAIAEESPVMKSSEREQDVKEEVKQVAKSTQEAIAEESPVMKSSEREQDVKEEVKTVAESTQDIAAESSDASGADATSSTKETDASSDDKTGEQQS